MRLGDEPVADDADECALVDFLGAFSLHGQGPTGSHRRFSGRSGGTSPCGSSLWSGGEPGGMTAAMLVLMSTMASNVRM